MWESCYLINDWCGWVLAEDEEMSVNRPYQNTGDAGNATLLSLTNGAQKRGRMHNFTVKFLFVFYEWARPQSRVQIRGAVCALSWRTQVLTVRRVPKSLHR